MGAHEPRIQPPVLEAYSDLPLFNTKAVVRQTGIPAPTLRAWERRYGVLAPRREENDYRLYSEREIVTVMWLRERVDGGMSISRAIALLKSLEPGRRGRRRAVATGVAHGADGAAAARDAVTAGFGAAEIQAALLRFLVHLDEVGAARVIAQTLAVYPAEEACLLVFAPVLNELGRLWSVGEVSVVVEHFGSMIVRAQLDALFHSTPVAESRPLVLVGCAPGERHEIGALMVALFLRRAGARVAYLGQAVEAESLLVAARSERPAAVVLSASLCERVEALGDLGARLADQPAPRPIFGFGGRAFETDPDLVRQVPGCYLGASPRDAVRETLRRLSD